MKQLLWLLLLALSSQVIACPQPNCVRVGSWNIEWLGSSKRQQPVDQNTIEQIADNIANKWSIDLITLQEINTDMSGEYRGETYSLLPWQRLKKALEKHGYTLAAGKTGYAQHIVIAWRKPVTALQEPSDLPIPDQYTINEFCRSANLRKPLGGLFKIHEFDFWLVGVHLKANTGPAACTTAIRSAQVEAMSRHFGKLADRDTDIILAGDFNASSQHASLNGLRESGFVSLTDRKQRHPDSHSVSYHSKRSQRQDSGSLLDQFMIQPGNTREWQANSTMIFKPDNAHQFANTYSDHTPLWTDFNTQLDDD